MIDVSNDVSQIETRTAAALQADESIDGVLAVGPHVCEAANMRRSKKWALTCTWRALT